MISRQSYRAEDKKETCMNKNINHAFSDNDKITLLYPVSLDQNTVDVWEFTKRWRVENFVLAYY